MTKKGSGSDKAAKADKAAAGSRPNAVSSSRDRGGRDRERKPKKSPAKPRKQPKKPRDDTGAGYTKPEVVGMATPPRHKNGKKRKGKRAGQGKGGAAAPSSQTRLTGKIGVHARYWSYLLSNLIRATDEIYEVCAARADTQPPPAFVTTLSPFPPVLRYAPRPAALNPTGQLHAVRSLAFWRPTPAHLHLPISPPHTRPPTSPPPSPSTRIRLHAPTQACELDESQLQCEEVISLLSTAEDDFSALIKRFEIHSAFERATTDGTRKPQSLAWSVRKISPIHATSPRPAVPPPRLSSTPGGSRPLSYADRVKGLMAKAAAAAAAAGKDGGNGAGPGLVPMLAELPPDLGLESDPEERATTPIEHSDPITPLPRSDPGIEPIPLLDNLSDDNFDAIDSSLTHPSHNFDTMVPNRSTSPFRWGDVTDTDTGSALGDSMPDMSSPLLCASPGGSVLLHQKLSSPSRKRSIKEYTRISNEKQDRALRAREKIQQEMADRLRAENTAKVEAAANRREDKGKRTIAWMTERMQRAEELRDSHLEGKRKKAQEEDAKINEIAFINKLEEENKKMEVIDKLNESQERLNELEEERQRKRTDSAAKQEAARARRFAMEAERKARLQLQESKRQAREEEVAQAKRRSASEREKASAQRLDAAHRRLYNDFDIISGQILRIFQPHAPCHAPYTLLCLVPVLIGC